MNRISHPCLWHHTFRLWVGAFFLFMFADVARAADTDHLVESVIARYDAIESASIEFTLTQVFTDKPNKITGAAVLAKDMDGREYMKLIYPTRIEGDQRDPDKINNVTKIGGKSQVLHLAGAEFARKYPGRPTVHVSRDGFDAIYTRHDNPDGTSNSSLLIAAPGKPFEAAFLDDPWKIVSKAGAIPFPETRAYVVDHAGEATHAGRKSVNGVESDVLEWRIEQKDYDQVFLNPMMYLFEGRQAILRLYVAPSLGDAVVKMEFASAKGTVKYWVDAAEFEQVAPGIFFPKQLDIYQQANHRESHYHFEVAAITNVNKPLDEDAFVIQLPANTQVRNSIPGQKLLFRLGEDKRWDTTNTLLWP